MANLFQRTFQNVRSSNCILLGPPPLQPAPTVPAPLPVPTLQPAPATPQLPVLHPAPLPPASTNKSIEFINSSRGKPKLLHDGYTYNYHKSKAHHPTDAE